VREVERISQSHQHHKNAFPPKSNHLRNRLDTTPALPVFPPQTNDFQKPIKFVSTLRKVFFEKESEKASGEEPVEKPSEEKPVEKPSEQLHPKPKPKPIQFHCGYCGKDGHKDEFFQKEVRREDDKGVDEQEWVQPFPWCT
jgi:hypothetical protein